MTTRMQEVTRRPLSIAIASGLACAALAAAMPARAGCTMPGIERGESASPLFQRAVFTERDRGLAGFMRISDEQRELAPIVGLWKFEMISKSTPTHKNPMPDGTLIDFGTAAWHSDGTELMNSGSRNPADGDFCQGVWAQEASHTFTLNHIALAYTNGVYTGPARIRERVTVEKSGQHFIGSFTLTQYLATLTPGHEFDESTKLVQITGYLTGTRVNAN